MKNIFLIAFSLFLLACSSKKSQNELRQNELLGFTQKFEFIENNDNRFVIVGTYLNPILFKNEFAAKSENFLLILYPDNMEFIEDSFKVNGNNQDIVIEKLDEDDELLKIVAINVPWGSYYKITSPAQNNTKNITLSFLTISNQLVKLNFEKVSASMYWNPAL